MIVTIIGFVGVPLVQGMGEGYTLRRSEAAYQACIASAASMADKFECARGYVDRSGEGTPFDVAAGRTVRLLRDGS